MSFRLRKYNNARIHELRQRRVLVLDWLAEYDKVPNLTHHVESIVLAKVVVEHLNFYIDAYERSHLDDILTAAVKDAAILKVSLEILT